MNDTNAPQHIETIRRDGYTILRDVLSPAENPDPLAWISFETPGISGEARQIVDPGANTG